jgi:hypothetical protein
VDVSAVNQKRREAKVVACNATHSARNCSLDLRYCACEAEIKGKRQAITGNRRLEYYLVELDEHQLERLTGMVREAIKVADEKELHVLEALLSALDNIRWKAGDRRTD